MILFGGRPVIGFADAGCPDNPPPPLGYVVWRGPVPAELNQWALALLRDVASPPFGKTWTTRSGSAIVIARKDRHAWAYRKSEDGSMTLVTGICIPGITLYTPQQSSGPDDVTDPATAQPDPSLATYSLMRPPERTSWGLVAASAGAGVTTVALFLWGLHAAGRR